ncbi:MAG: hypothetical protein ACI4SB_04245 [Acutalibacteraceae bacterium]
MIKTKTVKAVSAVLTLVMILLTLCSCGKDVPTPTFDEDNEYTGFASASGGYTEQKAESDGALILKDNKPTGKTKVWDSFVSDSEKGRNAFIRVASFSGEAVELYDLYFTDGKYRLFTRDKSGNVVDSGEYKYLVSAKDNGLNAYVLTDTPEVNAMQAIIQSYLSGEESQKTDYVLLGFTLHL